MLCLAYKFLIDLLVGFAFTVAMTSWPSTPFGQLVATGLAPAMSNAFPPLRAPFALLCHCLRPRVACFMKHTRTLLLCV